MRFLNQGIKLYNASSSECFGDTGTHAADETTPFRPRSPYAVAKSTAFWQVANYREAYNLFACSGILSNHESPLRPQRFVTQKIVMGACEIAHSLKQGQMPEKLHLGDISIRRDWGWAPEYVQAMYQMLQQPQPDDYVIATGVSYRLADFVEVVFSTLGLEWQDHVVTDSVLLRPTDIPISYLNPSKALQKLGWKASKSMPDVAQAMINAQQLALTN
jgi:GDPmannose 4,6-dehydratase